jgi:5-hmdU DNA kinase-like protein
MPALQRMFEFGHSTAQGSGPARTVRIGRREVNVTPVFDAYWRFAAERQSIFFLRLNGAIEPLTDDPVLRRFRFTNAYRASDRVSQYLIKAFHQRAHLTRSRASTAANFST